MDLDRLLRVQHGVCTTAQALESGVTEEALRWRVASGRWTRLGRGLYRAQTGELSWQGGAHAALLRGGSGSALALAAAEHVHGVVSKPPPVITIWVPAGREVTRLPGMRARARSGYRTARRGGLTVTDAAGTALDLADEPTCSATDAVAIVARWAQSRRVTPAELVTALAARPRHRHRRHLELALGVVADGAESLLEVGFVRDVVRAHGLPAPRLQAPGGTAGHLRRDAEFEAQGVVVELDGRLGHEGAALAADRARDRWTAATGRVTLRAGWVDVDVAPCALALDVAGALTVRGWTGRPRACRATCVVHRLGPAA